MYIYYKIEHRFGGKGFNYMKMCFVVFFRHFLLKNHSTGQNFKEAKNGQFFRILLRFHTIEYTTSTIF